MDFSASAVLQRIRNSLQNPANRLEGGFCMDNAQAVSEELARLDLMEVKPIPDRVLLDTAEGEYLDRKALDYNETRNPAEAAVGNLLFTGEPGTAIPIGTEALTPRQRPGPAPRATARWGRGARQRGRRATWPPKPSPSCAWPSTE